VVPQLLPISARCSQYRIAVASGEPQHISTDYDTGLTRRSRESVPTWAGTPIMGCGSAALWDRRNLCLDVV